MRDESPQPVDGEQAADADLAAGRTQDFDTLDALIADLDSAPDPADRGTPAPPQRRGRHEPMIRQPKDTL